MKECRKCHESLPFDQFWRNRRERDGLQPYCKTCQLLAIRKHVKVCHFCDMQFQGRASAKYCSKRCRARGAPKPSGEHHGNWKGGRRRTKQGYVMLHLDGRAVLEHRYVMEQHLGRPLAEHEDVHHKNAVRDDNRIENLELWERPHPRGRRSTDPHCESCRCFQQS